MGYLFGHQTKQLNDYSKKNSILFSHAVKELCLYQSTSEYYLESLINYATNLLLKFVKKHNYF